MSLMEFSWFSHALFFALSVHCVIIVTAFQKLDARYACLMHDNAVLRG